MITPKTQYLDATRRLVENSQGARLVTLNGLNLEVEEGVFDPSLFFSSAWFATEVSRLLINDSVFIDVGCGSGVVAIQAARDNPRLQVLATDISEQASRLTRRNTARNTLAKRVTAYVGDVFDGLPTGVRASTAFWAMPFGYVPPDTQLRPKESQVFDPGYRAIRKFFATAPEHLTESGRLLIGFSKDIGHLDLLSQRAHANNFELTLLTQTTGKEQANVSMEIYEARPKP